MIKDVKELSREELREFTKVFLKYFNEANTIINGKTPRFLETLLNNSKNKKYALGIISSICEGDKEGYVSFDDSEESITGFLVGNADGTVGKISHFFVDIKCPLGRRINALELYRAFSQGMARKGFNQVAAESSIKDDDLNDTLLSLGFSVVEEKNDVNEYARSIA